VQSGKGEKDRITILPSQIIEPLQEQVAFVKKLHECDLKNGYDSVYLPYALERKYPHAGKKHRLEVFISGYPNFKRSPNRYLSKVPYS